MAKHVGKTPVVVGNCIAFTANRIFYPYSQAASLLVDFGIDPYRIDKALTAFGMPMGVFQMQDLSGLDVGVHVRDIIKAAYGSRCYLSTLGNRLFAAKRLGQKTGIGIYKYEGGRVAKPDPKGLAPFLTAARLDALKASGLLSATSTEEEVGPAIERIGLSKHLSDQDIAEICLFPVVNESFRLLEEGHVIRASDIDVVSVMGYGFPSYKGGVMFWAESIGLRRVRDRLRYFSESFGRWNASGASLFVTAPLLDKQANQR